MVLGLWNSDVAEIYISETLEPIFFVDYSTIIPAWQRPKTRRFRIKVEFGVQAKGDDQCQFHPSIRHPPNEKIWPKKTIDSLRLKQVAASAKRYLTTLPVYNVALNFGEFRCGSLATCLCVARKNKSRAGLSVFAAVVLGELRLPFWVFPEHLHRSKCLTQTKKKGPARNVVIVAWTTQTASNVEKSMR